VGDFSFTARTGPAAEADAAGQYSRCEKSVASNLKCHRACLGFRVDSHLPHLPLFPKSLITHCEASFTRCHPRDTNHLLCLSEQPTTLPGIIMAAIITAGEAGELPHQISAMS
jgi:hypothetical protein